jgi:hypothetical protein
MVVANGWLEAAPPFRKRTGDRREGDRIESEPSYSQSLSSSFSYPIELEDDLPSRMLFRNAAACSSVTWTLENQSDMVF